MLTAKRAEMLSTKEEHMNTNQIIDLSLPVNHGMRGIEIFPNTLPNNSLSVVFPQLPVIAIMFVLKFFE